LFVSVGSLLTIPVSIVADKIFHGYLPRPLSFAGASLVVVGFLGLNLGEYLSHKKKQKEKDTKPPQLLPDCFKVTLY